MRSKHSRRTIHSLLGVALAASTTLAAAFVPACGGSNSRPPNLATVSPDAGAATTVTNDQGQVVGTTAGPEAKPNLPPEAAGLYNKAFQAWMAGDLQGAKDGFRAAAEKAPNAGAPHYSLGCVLERLGDVASAQGEYRQAFTVQPDYQIAMGALGVSLARTGHAGEASTFLEDQLKKNPESKVILSYLAEVYSLKGDDQGSAQAQKYAQQALSIDPSFVPAMLVIARDYFRQRKYETAKAAVAAILDGSEDKTIPAKDAESPEAKLLRAIIQRMQSDRAHAIDNFEFASKKRPDLVEAYINLGEMRLEAGNAAQAQAPLEAAIRYAPTSAVAHLDLGECYRLMGRGADAKREFDTALAQDSTLAAVHYNLGLLYLYTEDGKAPGTSNAEDQVKMAISEFNKYKSMAGSPARGTTDDVDQLISAAKTKQTAIQQAKANAAAAASASAAAANAPAPAPSGSAKP